VESAVVKVLQAIAAALRDLIRGVLAVTTAVAHHIPTREAPAAVAAVAHHFRTHEVAQAVMAAVAHFTQAGEEGDHPHIPVAAEAASHTHREEAEVAACHQAVAAAPFRPGTMRPPADRARQGPLKFVQFGYIGLNRRLLEVLEALAPLRNDVDFRFDIMGKVWDPHPVLKRIHELGLEDRVTIHGFVAEPELDARLAEAHLVFNLRYPTMGEASGSQLRIWNASAASVVTDLGWYGTLDNDTVFKIPLEGEADALRKLVRRLNADRTLGTRIGAAGRARLEARHAPARYARAITHVALQAPRDAHDAVLARQSRHVLARSVAVKPLQLQRLAARI
jgi:hypothetical protein